MDEGAFADFYRTHAAMALRRATRHLSAADASEAVSQAFEVVWRKRDVAPPTQPALDRWFATIVRLCILQERQRLLRKHHDSRFLLDLHRPALEPFLSDISVTVESSDGARRAFRALTDDERRLFAVAFLGESSVAGAAADLGISVNAYKTRVSRLRAKLRRLDTQPADGLQPSP